jgi:hypothetical protein
MAGPLAEPDARAVARDGGQALLHAMAEAGNGDMPFRFPFAAAEALFSEPLIIDVDPGRLNFQFAYAVELGGATVDPSFYFLGAGDWSRFLVPIAKSPAYRQAEQLHAVNPAFRRTASYRHFRKSVLAGRDVTLNHIRMDSLDKLDDYFRNYRRLLISAARHGIRRRPAGNVHRRQLNEARPAWAELSERDVGVAIDADGGLHRIGPGKHRTAVAKVLGLERMPCEVRMVHVEWLRRAVPVGDPSLADRLREAIAELSLPARSPGGAP